MPLFSGLAHRTPFYYGWVVAGAVSVTMMLSGTLAAPIFGIFIPAWTEEFGWSRTAIAGAFSFATVMAGLAGPLVGRALDKYGGRLVMGGGALMMGASLIGMGFVGSLVALYLVFSVGRAAMMSIQNLAAHTVIANWFIRRRAFATAVAVNGSRIGLGIWPVLAALVIANVGWREAFWALGAVVTLIAAAPLLTIIARRPEEVGLHPDGRPRPAPAPAGSRISPAERAWAERNWTAREAVRTSSFWFLMLTHMGVMLVGGGFGVHRIPFFLDRDLADAWVGPVLLLHAIGMLIGGFLAAWLMGFMPRRVVISVSMAAGAAAMLVALVVPPDAPIAVFTFLESMAFGGIFAMLPVVYADYFGRESIGTIRGLTHPIVVGSNAAGPLFAGLVFDATGGEYTWAFVSFSVVLGLGAISALLARPPSIAVDRSNALGDTPADP